MTVNRNYNILLTATLIFFISQSVISQEQWIEFNRSPEKVSAKIIYDSQSGGVFRYVLKTNNDTLLLLPKDVNKFLFSKRKKGDVILQSFSSNRKEAEFYQEKINNSLRIFENFKSKKLYINIENEIFPIEESDNLSDSLLNKILPYPFKLRRRKISNSFENLVRLDKTVDVKIKRYPGLYFGINSSFFKSNIDYLFKIRAGGDETPYLGEYFNEDQLFETTNFSLGLYLDYLVVPSWNLGFLLKTNYLRRNFKNYSQNLLNTTSMNGNVDYTDISFAMKKNFSISNALLYTNVGVSSQYKLYSDLYFLKQKKLNNIFIQTVEKVDIMPNFNSFFISIGAEIPYTRFNYIFFDFSFAMSFSQFESSFIFPKLSLGFNI